ncbi:MAG: HEAT repeat domain-containing protein [Desulfarculaceae bacterium]|jgi:hypothetical protein
MKPALIVMLAAALTFGLGGTGALAGTAEQTGDTAPVMKMLQPKFVKAGMLAKGEMLKVAKLNLMLRQKDPLVRRLAAYALGELGEKSATQPLLTLLNDSDLELHRIAIHALAKIADTRAIAPLIGIALSTNQGEQSRCWATCALIRMGDKNTLSAMAGWDQMHPHCRTKHAKKLSLASR